MEETTSQTADEAKVASSNNSALIDTCSLVLSSKNIRHRISRHTSATIDIYVPNAVLEKAKYQLDAFFRENKNWPPPQILPEKGSFPALLPTLIMAGSLAWFFKLTGPWNADSPWFKAGANNADAVLNSDQWYRVITALTLHADFTHMAGNCLIGAFLIYFFLQINGPGLGFLAIIISGATGNYINDILHGGDHVSVGFSTAVFGLIGMLAMYRIVEQRQPFGLRMFVPFMAGAALLAMLGSSGARTDLGSHLFGLTAGLGVGMVLASQRIRSLRQSSFMQACCLIFATSILLFSWNMAISTKIY